ncbi:MAG: dTDP-4-dehydrorhamnose 3,5-epimerase [Sulfuricellaceae bacterium]
MRFNETAIPGAYLVEIEVLADERGFFARSWCCDEFAQHGLNAKLVQCDISYNKKRGTLRGMHCQAEPFAEAKLVRCTMGAIYDVILDLRRDSSAFGRWAAVELSAANRRMLYIPEGVAHGFQTLEDDSEVFYQMSERYHPECARGVRWDDPAFGIAWPMPELVISERDQAISLVKPCT